MPKLIDIEWFSSLTGSHETISHIKDIFNMQQVALESNEMPLDNHQINLELSIERGSAVNEISFERGSAVNALEIFQEIFRDSDHNCIDGFSPSDKDVIVDLGANYGFYGLLVKNLNSECRYIGVEPNPYVFTYLEKNLDKFTNVDLLKAAVGVCDGVERFEFVRQLPSIAGRTLQQVERKWLDKELIDNTIVKSYSLRTLWEMYNIEKIDLLKIDIEGAEGELLCNTPAESLLLAERIVLERHTDQIRDDVIRCLEKIGFKLLSETGCVEGKNYSNLYFARKNLL